MAHRLIIAAGVFIGVGLGTSALAAPLTFADRVRAQVALERISWEHRDGPKLPFDEATVVPLVESRVRRSLAESIALDRVWGEKLTALRLRRELDRMVRASRMPGRLDELFDALGNDPVLLQEALARPALVGRLIRTRFAWDPELHAKTKTLADAAAALPRARVVEHADAFAVELTEADGATRNVTEFRKTSFESWWMENSHRFDAAEAPSVGDATVGAPDPPRGRAAAACTADDTWDGGLDSGGPPDRREFHAAVWTGSELIVWGGLSSSINFPYADGARYSPATDTWTPVAASPLVGRRNPSAVWNGITVIIWGGGKNPVAAQGPYTFYNDGAKYDPVADSWTPISAVGAPSGRWDAAAVWTGSQMLVYGGQVQDGANHLISAYDGRRYDPALNAWSAMAASPLASGVFNSGAWVGGRFWLWSSGQGAGYDPVANGWTAMSSPGAPSARVLATVVATDHEIVVWGGSNAAYLNDGRLYDPSSQTWRPMTGVGAPSARRSARAVWTGKAAFFWGGTNLSATPQWDGASYDPLLDTWSPAETRGAPSSRQEFSLTWTGTEAIVFGGVSVAFNDAKRYDPASRRWATLGDRAPFSTPDTGNAWTGNEWLLSTNRYDPVLDLWHPTPIPGQLAGQRAVWTGSAVVGFGGSTSSFAGGRYDPAGNTWSPMSAVGAPAPRQDHTLVWTGSRVIAWGGLTSGGVTNTGAAYDPVGDAWTPLSTTNAPSARSQHAAVWTGSRMIVWGGRSTAGAALGDGAMYNPSNDTWTPLPGAFAPTARWGHTAVSTGSKMVVWGGFDGSSTLGTGAAYDPASNGWSATSTSGAPAGRAFHAAVWTGHEMIVWGGTQPGIVNTGGRYDPSTDSWLPTTMSGAPAARQLFSMTWTGSLALVWGGGPASGGRYALGSARDDDGDGLSECAGDCNDGNPSAWTAPGEITDLVVAADKSTISWSAATSGSIGPPTYTLFRSPRPDVFFASSCPVNAILGTSATDASTPAPGAAFFYVVGAVNGCARTASAGTWSEGTDRSATCGL